MQLSYIKMEHIKLLVIQKEDKMKKVVNPQYNNCIITYYQHFTKEYYEVKHKETNRVIHSISLAEAYKVASLLELEHKACLLLEEQ